MQGFESLSSRFISFDNFNYQKKKEIGGRVVEVAGKK